MSYEPYPFILPPASDLPARPTRSWKVALFPIRVVVALLGLFRLTGGMHVFLPGVVQGMLRYGVFISALVFICLFYLKDLIPLIKKDIFLFLIIGMACLSFTWSDYPDVSLDHCFTLIRVSVFGVFFALAFSPRQQFNLLLVNCWLGAALSLLVIITMPSIGIDRVTHVGAWQGIYGHKNGAGSIFTLSALLFFLDVFFQKDRTRLWRNPSWYGLLLTSFLVLMTTSKSSLVRLLFLSLAIVTFRRYRWKGKTSVLMLSLSSLVCCVTGLIVFGNWEAILLGLDRDPTLTGRTIIWSKALEQFMQRPWLGFGKGSFWHTESDHLIYVAKHFSLSLNFLPSTAHNGYIELLIEVGIVGAFLFLLNFIPNIYSALIRAYRYRTAVDWLPLLIFTSLSVSNLTESMFISSPSLGINWMLYVLASLSLRQPPAGQEKLLNDVNHSSNI